MSMHRHAAIDDTVYLYFAANDTSGSGADGATPVAHVRLGGALATAAPVHSPTPVLLTNAAYPDGAYEVAIVCSTANGFAAGNSYGVFCSLAVDGQNPTGFIGGITLSPVAADVTQWNGVSVTLSATTQKPEVDVASMANSAPAAIQSAAFWVSAPAAANILAKYDGTGYAGGSIKEQVDTNSIAGSTEAATNLSGGAKELQPFVVGALASATSIPTNIIDPLYTGPDHFKNRNVTINREMKPIRASSGSPVVLTVDAFSTVPSQNDEGVIS